MPLAEINLVPVESNETHKGSRRISNSKKLGPVLFQEWPVDGHE